MRSLLCGEIPESRQQPHLRGQVRDVLIARNMESGEIGQLRDGGRNGPDIVVTHVQLAEVGVHQSLLGVCVLYRLVTGFLPNRKVN